MLEFFRLSNSRIRKKVFTHLFTYPQRAFYLHELASLLKEDPANLSKELLKLKKGGILIARRRGRLKYYSLNKEYPLYRELKSIITKTLLKRKKISYAEG